MVISFVGFIIFLTINENTFNDKYNNAKIITTGVNTAEELERLHDLKLIRVIS